MNMVNIFNNDNNILAGDELYEHRISYGLISYLRELWKNKKFTERSENEKKLLGDRNFLNWLSQKSCIKKYGLMNYSYEKCVY